MGVYPCHYDPEVTVTCRADQVKHRRTPRAAVFSGDAADIEAVHNSCVSNPCGREVNSQSPYAPSGSVTYRLRQSAGSNPGLPAVSQGHVHRGKLASLGKLRERPLGDFPRRQLTRQDRSSVTEMLLQQARTYAFTIGDPTYFHLFSCLWVRILFASWMSTPPGSSAPLRSLSSTGPSPAHQWVQSSNEG